MRDRALACLVVPALLVGAGVSGCRKGQTLDHVQMTLRVESPDIREGGTIPRQFTCDGAGVSPAVSWQQAPEKTRSLALVVRDPDAPVGTFIHWVIYNLPPGTRGLPEGVAKEEQLPDGSRQGMNSNDEIGYYPPCPPGGAPHRYIFTVYALDQMLALPSRTDESRLTGAMKGHVLAAGQLMGRYGR